MAGVSKIEWCQHTWNAIVGCSIVSPGCTNCYAMRDAWRKHHNKATPHYHGLTKKVNDNIVWTGEVRKAPEHILLEPLRRKKPTVYFVNSMGDLFHESIPDKDIDDVFAVMALSPQHTFQVLTKRAERMRGYMSDAGMHRRVDIAMVNVLADAPIARLPTPITDENYKWPLPNCWLGVSAERQQEADERIPLLLQTPAAVRFVSAEPLLGAIDFTRIQTDEESLDVVRGQGSHHSWAKSIPITKLDWVITGGESGSKARPMHPDWARKIRDDCAVADVAFFFKQHGEWIGVPDLRRLPNGGGPGFGSYDRCRYDQVHEAVRVGKKTAGRLLDGVEWNEFPNTQSQSAPALQAFHQPRTGSALT